MADYNKQTVAQLRQLLKDRGIPSTGLQRKAQIIEKLQEADQEAEQASAEEVENEAVAVQRDAPSDDAPPDPVAQVEQEAESDKSPKLQDAHVLALEEDEPAEKPDESPATAPIVPVATIDANRENVSHIDSDIPPPDRLKAIAGTAEETVGEEELDGPQPAGIFRPPPTDPEDVVGPKITEPSDAEMEDPTAENNANEESPGAPGPAAEALRPESQSNADANKAPSPTPSEKPTIEKQELLPIPERSTAETSRLNSEELEADSRKRKRRSNSPDLPSQDIKAKKARPSQEPAPEVYMKEDKDIVMEQRRPEESAVPGDARHDRREKSDRYKDLIGQTRDDAPLNALQDDRPVAPALHSATSALYIRDFMRPLRPEPLRAHLISLASPPSSSPDSSNLKALFLDPMKTHALVLFSSITAASRVRASLHGSIWPPEGNRKELWVDFIPDDKVEEWIKEEEDAVSAEKEARANGRSMAAKRFEVVYPETSDGTVTAVFQEVGVSAPMAAQRAHRDSVDARRPSQHLPSAPTRDARQDIEQSFKTLDQLFSSTKAKPNLYYLPVSDEISERRLKELDAETSRDWAPDAVRKGRGIKTEAKYKYSFDEDDRIVELDEDRAWGEEYRGRGGFRGRGRGGRGGFWRG